MEIKLKPCPFCGWDPVLFEAFRGGDDGEFLGWFYACNNIDCDEMFEGDICNSEDEAKEDWNRRADNE